MNKLLSIATLACGLLASCSNDEPADAGHLPDGRYPLQLTVEVAAPQSHAGGKDAWSGGEEIGVIVDGMLGPKKYVMDASGNASPANAENAIYWRSTAETRVTAWYPDIDWPYVDISDQRSGYAAFDVLYASTVSRYDARTVLKFNHRMAKIEFTLSAGKGIKAEDVAAATASVLGDATAYISCGMIGAADQSDGEIHPYHDASTNKFEAIVVPQDMTGRPLIRISLGGSTFDYTPATEAAGNLKSGKLYTYAITVNADGIEVATVSGSTWGDNGMENISSVEVAYYTADQLKIGDYFYSDGTWSDGGLRKRYPDGRVEIANPKPAPVLKSANGKSRTVLGIVFQTDPNRIGAAEKSKLGNGKVHGLVMAVKDAAMNIGWTTYNRDESLTNCQSKAQNYNDISGYGNCEQMRNVHGGFDDCPAFKAADDYNTVYPAPTTTTGWYLPASGQWWDILQNLGCCPGLALSDEQNSSIISSDYHWYTRDQSNLATTLNEWMTLIADESKETFSVYNFRYWASSEYTEDMARRWATRGFINLVACAWELKTYNCNVRPVLAF